LPPSNAATITRQRIVGVRAALAEIGLALRQPLFVAVLGEDGRHARSAAPARGRSALLSLRPERHDGAAWGWDTPSTGG